MLNLIPFTGSGFTLLEFEEHVVFVVNNICELQGIKYYNIIELISLTF